MFTRGFAQVAMERIEAVAGQERQLGPLVGHVDLVGEGEPGQLEAAQREVVAHVRLDDQPPGGGIARRTTG